MKKKCISNLTVFLFTSFYAQYFFNSFRIAFGALIWFIFSNLNFDFDIFNLFKMHREMSVFLDSIKKSCSVLETWRREMSKYKTELATLYFKFGSTAVKRGVTFVLYYIIPRSLRLISNRLTNHTPPFSLYFSLHFNYSLSFHLNILPSCHMWRPPPWIDGDLVQNLSIIVVDLMGTSPDLDCFISFPCFLIKGNRNAPSADIHCYCVTNSIVSIFSLSQTPSLSTLS